MHGLGGDRRQTWTLEGNPDMCWISQAFPRARIMLYGYETSEETSSCFTRRGIFDEAARFLELFQGLNVENRRPIMFVSHGIGGSLVKAALVLATQDMPKFSKLVMRVRVLIFFGCPHRSVDIDEMREQILKHVYQLQSSAKLHGSILPLVNSLTETVNDVNGLFIHTKMLIQTHLINVFCSCPSEQVFAKSTVLMHTPLEQKIESQTPHSTMTRLDPQMVNKFRSLKTEDWLERVLLPYFTGRHQNILLSL
ncbi:hypothetical protein F5X99DRAFT_216695 [Biscogniauxia marginata]|nr:hypothetical protein F5X99DRAFT_216695 [Biscogniauxia marginata]